MGRGRKEVLNSRLLDSAKSMAANVTGTAVYTQYFDAVSFQCNWTGTPTGTFGIEVSLDYDPVSNPSVTWIPVTLSPTVSASGSADRAILAFPAGTKISVPWMRPIYTRSSGTGSLDIYVTGQES
jgi:hypothetical protein